MELVGHKRIRFKPSLSPEIKHSMIEYVRSNWRKPTIVSIYTDEDDEFITKVVKDILDQSKQ